MVGWRKTLTAEIKNGHSVSGVLDFYIKSFRSIFVEESFTEKADREISSTFRQSTFLANSFHIKFGFPRV